VAGVHGDTGQPGLPCHGACLGLRGLQEFDKYLLGNVLGFVGIGEQQTTQVHHPRVMPAVKLFVVGRCLRYGVDVRHNVLLGSSDLPFPLLLTKHAVLVLTSWSVKI
jgi:hypothetical protein